MRLAASLRKTRAGGIVRVTAVAIPLSLSRIPLDCSDFFSVCSRARHGLKTSSRPWCDERKRVENAPRCHGLGRTVLAPHSRDPWPSRPLNKRPVSKEEELPDGQARDDISPRAANDVYKDGVVSYKLSVKVVHDGYLVVGDKTYPPTNTKVMSDVELCTISFTPDGLVQSYTIGLMVETIPLVVDPAAVAEIADIEKRIENQTAKMASLEGQESSIAYTKCQADIKNMRMEKENLEDKVNSSPNTQGFGGIQGLLAAVGAEFPADPRDLEGADAYEEIEGQRSAVFSFPSEVRQYSAFDEQSFNEV